MDADTMNEQRMLAMLKALSDANRLRIVELVADTDNICALDILEKLDITQPTLSHHMKALASCGLITSSKEGRWRRYSISQDAVRSFMSGLSCLLAS